VSTATGLANDNVKKLHVRGKEIWAGTTDGLSQIVITARHPLRYRITTYDLSDGLPSNRIQDIAEANGFLWVATDNGLSFFRPGSLEKPGNEVPVYITRLNINSRDTGIAGSYELPYDYNNIKISFLALSYKNAGKLLYRYKMEGLDTSWIYTSARETQYTTLPAGDYRFVVGVRLHNGTWSNTMAGVQFRISLPFWKTWWFQLIVLSVVALLIGLAFRHRLKLAQERNEFNRNLLNLKLKALRAQMNPHFIFNCLNSIQNYIIRQQTEGATFYLSKFADLVRQTLNNASRIHISLWEEINYISSYLELERMQMGSTFTYTIDVAPDINPLEPQIPNMVTQPYIENAIKHGLSRLKTEGVLQVSYRMLWEQQVLECTITDNGPGINFVRNNITRRDHKPKGMSITQERITMLNKMHGKANDITVEIKDLGTTGTGQGTHVVIHFPLLTEPTQ